MSPTLDARTDRRIEGLALRRGRPLIVSDADEVLFFFMRGFEHFLNDRGFDSDWSSYGLVGNIRDRKAGGAIAADEARALLGKFFDSHTETLEPVPGAAAALARLSERAQVVVLSNLPFSSQPAREKALAKAGMPFPLVVNAGMKGVAVRRLQDRVEAPVIFIDDILHQHVSVRQMAQTATRLHFVADPRLARLLGPSEDVHHRADDWTAAAEFIDRTLAEAGF